MHEANMQCRTLSKARIFPEQRRLGARPMLPSTENRTGRAAVVETFCRLAPEFGLLESTGELMSRRE